MSSGSTALSRLERNVRRNKEALPLPRRHRRDEEGAIVASCREKQWCAIAIGEAGEQERCDEGRLLHLFHDARRENPRGRAKGRSGASETMRRRRKSDKETYGTQGRRRSGEARRRRRVVGSTCVLAATNYPTTTQHGSTTRNLPASYCRSPRRVTPSQDTRSLTRPCGPSQSGAHCTLYRDHLKFVDHRNGQMTETLERIIGSNHFSKFYVMSSLMAHIGAQRGNL